MAHLYNFCNFLHRVLFKKFLLNVFRPIESIIYQKKIKGGEFNENMAFLSP